MKSLLILIYQYESKNIENVVNFIDCYGVAVAVYNDGFITVQGIEGYVRNTKIEGHVPDIRRFDKKNKKNVKNNANDKIFRVVSIIDVDAEDNAVVLAEEGSDEDIAENVLGLVANKAEDAYYKMAMKKKEVFKEDKKGEIVSLLQVIFGIDIIQKDVTKEDIENLEDIRNVRQIEDEKSIEDNGKLLEEIRVAYNYPKDV